MHKLSKFHNKNHNQGFTLVEFMVASFIGLIVLAAVGSIYLYTNRLNDTALIKIEKQQQIRYASNTLTRDANMAGNFGCLSLGQLGNNEADNQFRENFNFTVPARINNILIYMQPPKKNGNVILKNPDGSMGALGLNIIPTTTVANLIKSLGFSNFTPIANSPALLFYYASGISTFDRVVNSSAEFSTSSAPSSQSVYQTAASKNGLLALSSCKELTLIQAQKTDSNTKVVTVDVDATLFPDTDHYQLSLNKLNMIFYIIGSFNNGPNNFYRIELLDDGSWSQPETLIENVNSINIDALYATEQDTNGTQLGCPNSIFDSEKPLQHDNYQFIKEDVIAQSRLVLPTKSGFIAPSAIELILNAQNTFDANNQNIRIVAAIQGGNICANRKLQTP